jgi:hypothetical protein
MIWIPNPKKDSKDQILTSLFWILQETHLIVRVIQNLLKEIPIVDHSVLHVALDLHVGARDVQEGSIHIVFV